MTATTFVLLAVPLFIILLLIIFLVVPHKAYRPKVETPRKFVRRPRSADQRKPRNASARVISKDDPFRRRN